MSEAFKDILYNSHPGSMMDNIHLAALIVCLIVPVITRRFWLSLLINSCILFIASSVIDFLFFDWWNNLKEHSRTRADQQWIADHDGGLIIVVIEIMFKSFGTLMLSMIVAFIMAKYFKDEKEEKPELDPICRANRLP